MPATAIAEILFLFPFNLRGNNGRISVRQLFTLFLFFEIMGLTSFVMVIQEETAAAGRAARTYLAIAVIGGLCALFGIFMIAAGTGNLSMDSLEQFRKATGGTWPLYLAGALLLAGFGAKAGMYPLHVWLPNAHPVAPALPARFCQAS